MKLLILYNPKAGFLNKNTETLLKEYLIEKDHIFEFYYVHVNLELEEIFDQSQIEYDVVLVSGGDGTVSSVVDFMYKNDIKKPLLILPSGSANEYSATLKLSSNVHQAVDLLDDMNIKSIDIGCVNDSRYFIYALSFGNFTHLSYTTPRSFKKRLGYFGYWLYGATSFYLFRLKKYSANIEVNGQVLEGHYLNGGITNSYSMGGVIQYDKKEVDLNDGLFEMYMMKMPDSFKSLCRIIRSILTRKYDNQYFDMQKSSSFSINLSKKHSFNVDGEFLGKFSTIKVMVIKRAIDIIVAK